MFNVNDIVVTKKGYKGIILYRIANSAYFLVEVIKSNGEVGVKQVFHYNEIDLYEGSAK